MALALAFGGACSDEADREAGNPDVGGTILDERCPPNMLFVPAATFETGLAGGRDDEQPMGEATSAWSAIWRSHPWRCVKRCFRI